MVEQTRLLSEVLGGPISNGECQDMSWLPAKKQITGTVVREEPLMHFYAKCLRPEQAKTIARREDTPPTKSDCMSDDEIAAAAVLRVVGEDEDSYEDLDPHPGSLDLDLIQ